ncbi:MAG: hypothetical protein AMXMBFR13_06440 [Phycisphaerae bacterium]
MSYRGRIAICLVVIFCIGASAEAAFTPTLWPHAQYRAMLNHIYFGGADALQGDGPHFATAGGVTATRIDDYGVGGVIDLASTVAADDPVWTGGPFTATIKYKEGARPSLFGTGAGVPSQFSALLNSEGPWEPVTVASPPGQWRWGMQVFTPNVPTPRATFWSDPTLNQVPTHEGRDYMLTYRIDGLNDLPIWVLLWEDGPYEQGDLGDGDYNDLVVEIVPIPEPAGLLLAACAAALLAQRRRPQN